MAGGTALEQEEESSSYLLIGLALLAVVIAVVVYVALDDDDAIATSKRDQPTESHTQPVSAPRDNSQEPLVGIPTNEEPPTPLEKREQAVAELGQDLTADRLWSTLSIEDSTLKVVSGACADQAMQPAIKKHVGSLSSVGLTMVRCVEKHGALVFEQSL